MGKLKTIFLESQNQHDLQMEVNRFINQNNISVNNINYQTTPLIKTEKNDWNSKSELKTEVLYSVLIVYAVFG